MRHTKDMNTLLVLVLAAQAAVRVAPVKAPARAALPTPAVSAAPALSAALTAATPVLTPALAPSAQLQDLGEALAPEAKQAPEAALSAAFDKSQQPKAEAAEVAAPAAAAGARFELAASQAHAKRFEQPAVEKRGLKTRAWEAAELGAYTIPFHAASVVAALGDWSPAFQAAVWAAGGWLLVQRLAELRSTVVGGWQASHDQKYRVGYDGRVRDIRGHKYGEDRYEEYAPGAVTKTEKTVIGLLAAAAAALWMYAGLN